jgi:hypothetical protein
MKHFRPILIKAALNGLKVEVGCKEFVYQEDNLAQFLIDLQDYLLNPEETEKKFAKKYGFDVNQPVEESRSEGRMTQSGAIWPDSDVRRIHEASENPKNIRPLNERR